MLRLLHQGIATFCLSLLLSNAALAAPLSVGALSRDSGSPLIRDSLNQLEWLGWDVTRGLSHAQTLAAIAPGGQFAGFRLADRADADRFADALFGARDWATPLQTLLNFEDNRVELLLGENYQDLRQRGYGYESDYIFFASGNGAGLLEVATDYLVGGGPSDRYLHWNRFGSIAQADNLGKLSPLSTGIGWLLVREPAANTVPAPGALALGLLALAAAALARRRPGHQA